MADTYTLISSVTVGAGGASSIDFTSIPATYTDLLLVTSTRGTSGGIGYNIMALNGSSSNFSTRQIQGTGASVSSETSTAGRCGTYVGSTDTSNTFSNNLTYIPNYAGSTYKSYSVDAVNENNGSTAYSTLLAGLWSNTAAITSISISTSGGVNFAQYSTAYLYGIKNS